MRYVCEAKARPSANIQYIGSGIRLTDARARYPPTNPSISLADRCLVSDGCSFECYAFSFPAGFNDCKVRSSRRCDAEKLEPGVGLSEQVLPVLELALSCVQNR